MKLTALKPQSGRTFTLRVTGNLPANRLLLAGGVVALVLFLWLVWLGVPRLPEGLSPENRRQMHDSLRMILLGLKAFSGLVTTMLLTGYFISGRAFEVLVDGDPDGGLQIEGAAEGGSRRLAPELAPYSIGVLRRVVDVPRDSLAESELHLYSSASEDDRADEALAGLLHAELVVLDRNATRHLLLSVPERLPGDAEEQMNQLRELSGGRLEKVRGGGFVLHLPPPAGDE